MHKNVARGIAAVVAGAALGAAGASGAGPAGTAAAAAQVAGAGSAGTSPAAAPSGSRLWIARYNGPPGTDNVAASMAVSPDGTRVFVTGWSARARTGPGGEFATVGYKTATGAVRWIARYDSPGSPSYDQAYAVAVSRDGRTVFVTGYTRSPDRPRGDGSTTIAYRAADGTQRWAVSDGPLASSGGAEAVAVSPDGGTVLVTGNDYATVAYRAATGAQLWASPRLDASDAGPGAQPRASRSLGGYATALAVSPDGRKVFVTGPTFGPTSGSSTPEFTAVALSTATGTRLWVNRYQGPRNLSGYGVAVAVSPDGHRVYVAGHTAWAIPRTLAYRYTIIAYRA